MASGLHCVDLKLGELASTAAEHVQSELQDSAGLLNDFVRSRPKLQMEIDQNGTISSCCSCSGKG